MKMMKTKSKEKLTALNPSRPVSGKDFFARIWYITLPITTK